MNELTKVQLQASMNKLLEQENELSSVLKMTLNGLINFERSIYLEDDSIKRNEYTVEK
jgi:hypothetical protein